MIYRPTRSAIQKLGPSTVIWLVLMLSLALMLIPSVLGGPSDPTEEEFNIEFEGPSHLTLVAGERETIPMSVTNLADTELEVLFGVNGHVPGLVWVPGTIELGPGEERTVEFVLSSSADVAVGEYTMVLTATEWDDDLTMEFEVTVDVSAPKVRGYLIQGIERVQVEEGGTAQYKVLVQNTGNVPIELDIDVRSDFPGELDYSETVTIGPGEERELEISAATAEGMAGGYPIKVYVQGPDGDKKAAPSSLIITPLDDGSPEPPVPVTLSPVVPAVAVASISIIGLAGFLFTETGKYSMFKLGLLFLPMFSRLSKEQVLDNFIRGKIFRFIEEKPGEHYSAIGKRLMIRNGVLAHHLKTLEREGYVRSKADGHLRRFYPRSMKIPTKEIESLSWFQIGIIDIIRKDRGIRQKDIAKRMEESKQVINYHLRILVEAGIVTKVKKGRETLYDVDERRIRMLPRVDTDSKVDLRRTPTSERHPL